MREILYVAFATSAIALLCAQSCERALLPNVPVTENVSFEKHIRPITSSVCISCHYRGSRDLTRYENAFSLRYTIKQRVVVDRSMPMGKYLSDQDRALFRDWVDQGAKR
jgi:hypothetical protein